MSDVTRILSQIDSGDPAAAEQLLPLVYDELRKLAAAKLAQERPGQTLQATALVHEAYLRLVAGGTRDSGLGTSEENNAAGAPSPGPQPLVPNPSPSFHSRGHFFAAAAEAMRRILVDQARRRNSLKRGGELERVELPDLAGPTHDEQVDLLALDEALRELESEEPDKARLVKLRFFAGCSLDEAAEYLGISRATAQRKWAYARAWLFGRLNRD
jgi:RNA polymerase sigma factor (sigma-70 family)